MENKIEKLTDEQKSKIAEYREEYFRRATCTKPSDRKNAEVAAKSMTDGLRRTPISYTL